MDTNEGFEIVKSIEMERKCGFRKKGGYYFIADSEAIQRCDCLPIPLETCPCCGHGIKFSRGSTWIDPRPLLKGKNCKDPSCPLNNPDTLGRNEVRVVRGHKKAKSAMNDMKRIMPGIESLEMTEISDDKFQIKGWYPHVLLLWVGKNFYGDFNVYMDEALRQGISRRIKTIPRNFTIGKTTVWLAHINCIKNPDGTKSPGVFFSFVPKVDYVVNPEKDTSKKLKSLYERGVRLVDVIPADDDLFSKINKSQEVA